MNTLGVKSNEFPPFSDEAPPSLVWKGGAILFLLRETIRGMGMEQYIVELEHITKEFPGVKALDDVRFNLKPGEVLAFLGENGAGKSTLMKILSGVYTKDSGTIRIDGQTIDHMNPTKAQELGVAIIHQELNMCAHLSVAENIFLGREKTRSGVLSNREMNESAAQVLEQLKVDIEPDTIVGSLPVSKQQMVEIAKALSTNARILIMDEPTSALTSAEIEELFRIINQLKKEGKAIVYISHRLEELQYITDRVIILRDGQYITTLEFNKTNLDEIVSYMVGREITEKFPHIECKKGQKILEIKKLNAGRMVRDINLDLYEGEIVGIAGLMGAGRTETTRALFGVDSKESGEIILDGKTITINKPVDAIRAGIVLAPEDRKKDGLCTKLSVADNIALPNLDILSNSLGVVSMKKQHEMVDRAVNNLKIKLAGSYVDSGSLSGGNQQKIVVGKWLARNSRVVIFDEPTRGIDVAAKVEIYHLMNELKAKGIGVLFVSSEMPEVLGISDRIIIMCDGRITGEVMAREATQDQILKYATQFEKKVD